MLAAVGACSPEPSAMTAPTPDEPTPVAAKRFHRDIPVRLACDEEFRAQDGWEATARGRFESASAVYENRFGIRWEILDVVEWKSDDVAASLGDLLDQLEKDAPRAGAEVVFGFTGQTRATDADRDYRIVGCARYYRPNAIVRSRPHASEAQYVRTIVHELGHVLGAWHSSDPRSVMNVSHQIGEADEFDPQSVAAIKVARGIDFARGVEWLNRARRRGIDKIYRRGHAAGVVLPYVSVQMDVARELTSDDATVATARAACRTALANQAACVGPSDPSLASCLRALAWAELAGSAPDVGEAERFATSAQSLAGQRTHEWPLLEGEFLLAHVAWERGRRHEAIARLRDVYEARRAARGVADPDTAAARRALDRRVREEPPTRAGGAASPVVDDASPLTRDPEIAFHAPRPDTIHVRRAPLTKAWSSGAPPSDFGRDAFDVAVAAPGTLAVELVEIGGAPGAVPEVCCRVAAHVPATVNERTASAVGFGYWTVDPKIPADGAAYRFALVVRSPENPRGSTIESVDCEAPWSAQSSVDRAFDAAGATFVRFPVGAVELFRREWLDVPPGPPVALGDVSPKRTWRLVLTFVPDPSK